MIINKSKHQLVDTPGKSSVTITEAYRYNGDSIWLVEGHHTFVSSYLLGIKIEYSVIGYPVTQEDSRLWNSMNVTYKGVRITESTWVGFSQHVIANGNLDGYNWPQELIDIDEMKQIEKEEADRKSEEQRIIYLDMLDIGGDDNDFNNSLGQLKEQADSIYMQIGRGGDRCVSIEF